MEGNRYRFEWWWLGLFLVFDCDRLGRWTKLGGTRVYRVSSEIWPDRNGLISVIKREIWRGEVFSEERKKKGNEGVCKGSGVSRFIKDINYNGVSKRKRKKKEKAKRKRNLRKIVHSMLVFSVKMSKFLLIFFFLSIFYSDIIFM